MAHRNMLIAMPRFLGGEISARYTGVVVEKAPMPTPVTTRPQINWVADCREHWITPPVMAKTDRSENKQHRPRQSLRQTARSAPMIVPLGVEAAKP